MDAKATSNKVTEFSPRDEWMIQDYMAKGYDRATAEALTVLNNCGQHKI